MARIPTADDLGERRIAQTRAVRVAVNDSASDALINFGERLAQIQERKQRREDQISYSKASTAYALADAEIRKELENDQDYETHEKRYTERMAKAKDEAGKLIRSNHDRALFDDDARVSLERGSMSIRSNAKRIWTDSELASAQSDMERNRAAALEAKDPDLKESLIKSTTDRIEGLANRGLISRKDAETWRQRWTQDYADGAVSMLPAADRVKVLSNPEGTPAQYLQPDVRVELRRRAENEIRIERERAEAEARARQAEARQALTERVVDAKASYLFGMDYDDPPSKAEFVAAYGAEDGAKRYQSFAKLQQLGADLSELALLPEDEQSKRLADRAPEGTAGAAEDVQRYQALLQRTEQLRTARDRDPAAYVARYSRPAQEALVQSGTEEGARAYATVTIAEQERLGVRNPKVLSDQMASDLAQSFHTMKGEDIAVTLQQEAAKWGPHWPRVYAQLAENKIPSAALAIGRGMDIGAATRLASVATVPMDEMKKGIETPATDIREQITFNMRQFGSTLDGVIGAENTFSAMYDAVERLTYSYMRQGKKLSDASEQAYAEVIGDNYAFHGVNGRIFRVPVEHDMPGLDVGARRALEGVKANELQAPVPMGTSSAENASADLERVIKKRGYWVTSADGEKGLALFLDGAPVLRKDGSVYEVSFDDLNSQALTRREQIEKGLEEERFRQMDRGY